MTTQRFDALIVGAGLSGIGLACHLKMKCPQKTFTILEARDAIGGTWDLFRYPGIRSDSDMYTLGYSFHPWRGEKDIADGRSILQYIRETATEHQIDKHIRFHHAVRKASWSTSDACWTVEVQVGPEERVETFQCGLLLMCPGYYKYSHGYTPDFPGRDRFRGRVIHPQNWPEDFDCKGKQVVVIGSGATAVTLVPAIAKTAEHVVMLQRSPTYVVSRPETGRISHWLRRILPASWAHRIVRWMNIEVSQQIYRRSRSRPAEMREWLLSKVRQQLGPDFDVDKHFSPRYDPWDQRLCVVPDGDLFTSIQSGKVSVVTDQIECFTESGIRVQSGEALSADVIVTATGLRMQALGGAEIVVDDQQIDFAESFTYLGMMYSGVPNLVTTFGYINASWTLRSDLIAEFICRMIKRMDEKQVRQCTPRLRPSEREMKRRPFIERFSSNYIQRTVDHLPKQGDHAPWVNTQDYKQERKLIGRRDIDDGVLVFDNPIENPAAASSNDLASCRIDR